MLLEDDFDTTVLPTLINYFDTTVLPTLITYFVRIGNKGSTSLK